MVTPNIMENVFWGLGNWASNTKMSIIEHKTGKIKELFLAVSPYIFCLLFMMVNRINPTQNFIPTHLTLEVFYSKDTKLRMLLGTFTT